MILINENEIKERIWRKNKETYERHGGNKMFEYIKNEKSDDGMKNLLDKLAEIDKKYTIQDSDPREILESELPKYERMEVEEKTEEEIYNAAVESLKNYENSEKGKIDEKYNEKLNSANEKIAEVGVSAISDAENISLAHDLLADKTLNKNIKKGLAHSSIMTTQLEGVENSKIKNLQEAHEKAQIKIESLTLEKSLLEQQKENALNGFDITYAIKLSDKIANINKEIAKNQEAAQKYNNSISLQEEKDKLEREKLAQKYESDIEKRNQELIKLINQYGVSGLEKLKAQEKYEIILNHLIAMPKAQALNELDNNIFYQQQLGAYYPSIYAAIYNKKE